MTSESKSPAEQIVDVVEFMLRTAFHYASAQTKSQAKLQRRLRRRVLLTFARALREVAASTALSTDGAVDRLALSELASDLEHRSYCPHKLCQQDSAFWCCCSGKRSSINQPTKE